MATFDQLPDEQRAIVELVLQQGKSYEELSEMLDIPESRVRERARDALVDLAPVSARGVEEDWRGQLADYVLGQQDGPEATATRGHLRRSEAARSWTRSLLDSLEQLYRNGDLPAIPEPDRSARRTPRAAAEPSEGAPLGSTPVAGIERRWLIAGLGGLVLILLIVLVWPVGVLTGGDDSKDGGSNANANANANASTPINKKRQGAAVIAQQNGKTQILVQATGLEPSTQSSAYQVWLYDSQSKRKSLGATATDTSGNLQVVGTLPADYKSWQYIDVTSVTITGSGNNRNVKTGPSVLRGALKLADKPVQTGTGKNKATVLAQISLLPLPNSGG
jgi:Sigma-70, region 4/Anti-sigma-K factor rskA, C-terminal